MWIAKGEKAINNNKSVVWNFAEPILFRLIKASCKPHIRFSEYWNGLFYKINTCVYIHLLGLVIYSQVIKLVFLFLKVIHKITKIRTTCYSNIFKLHQSYRTLQKYSKFCRPRNYAYPSFKVVYKGTKKPMAKLIIPLFPSFNCSL